MLVIFFLIAYFLLIPSTVFAWGPLTHIYLGSEIYYFASLLPPAVAALIRRYRQDFLYGNLMADIVLAKKYMPDKRNSHNWDVAADLTEAASNDAEKVFSMGYMSHLAADTVAHGTLTAGTKNLGHAFLELGADSMIDRGYWFQALDIDKKVQARNDALMERCLDVVVFSFRTNKKFFKGALALSCINGEGLAGMFSTSSARKKKRNLIEGLHEESLDRIIDVLSNGTRSEVLKKNPIAESKKNRFFKTLLG